MELHIGFDIAFMVLSAAALFIGWKILKKRPAGAVAREVLPERFIRPLFWVVFVLGVFLRFYRLAELPALDCDEASSMYDAWNIANFGYDRWLYSYPIYFSGLAGGQSPMCLYLLALVAKIFGYNILAYRCVFAAAGVATMVLVYIFVKDILGRKAALLAFYIAALMPLMVQFSRYCLDCNLMMPFFTAALIFLGRALKDGSRRHLLLAGILCGLTLYTYIVSYVVMFIMVVMVAFACLISKRFSLKDGLVFLAPLGLLAVVPALNFLVQMGLLGEFTVGPFSFYKIAGHRTGDMTLSHVFDMSSKLDSIIHTFLGQLPSVYYSGGRTIFYIFLIPFMANGVIRSVAMAVAELRQKKPGHGVLMVSGIAAFGSIMMAMNTFYSSRINSAFILFIVIALIGMTDRDCNLLKSAAAIVSVAMLILSMIYYSYMFSDQFYRESRLAKLSDFGLHEVYSSIREEFPDNVVWVDTFSKETQAVIPYVIALGSDLEDPKEIYDTTIADFEYPRYGKARFYIPYDYVSESYIVNDEDIYIIATFVESETRRILASELIAAGFSCEEHGNFLVYQKAK